MELCAERIKRAIRLKRMALMLLCLGNTQSFNPRLVQKGDTELYHILENAQDRF